MTWFAETRLLGAWRGCTFAEQPTTKKVAGVLRIARSNGVGPEIRRDPVRIAAVDNGKTLTELTAIYGGEGEDNG